ncbi:class I SAM-dependent DNA methyltransferase [Thauera sp. 2A1]|uniref:type I restriction-modification system subunit M n=1 Tax=Thauera sp. 2A1 TaxID=2570191 RepID=UPI001292B2AA|nr:class I SAM-dependent DNA methyltransferase [Thauera sp. 2A1]KAI5915590.1 type I restriction-modification system subunit M [Thauera sp. 2A1]
MPSHTEIGEFIWRIADHLRGDYEKNDNEDVILPFTLLRRLDCVLEKTRDKVREAEAQLAGKVTEDVLKKLLVNAAGVPFYNRSRYSFPELLKNPSDIKENFGAYLDGFSDNIKEILYNFSGGEEKGLAPIYETLARKNLLYLITREFASEDLDLHPDKVSNHDMGLIYEYLIRKFKEGAAAGEQYTPRDVVQLLVQLVFADVEHDLKASAGSLIGIYDPACGTGGMLTVSKDYLVDEWGLDPSNIFIHGQELREKTYAICKADALMKGDDGSRIKQGNTLSEDKLIGQHFNFMMANPEFGTDWKKIESFIRNEAERGTDGRFGAGLPDVGDASLLFLQHMISKMTPVDKGGSVIGIVFNGSPLFNGDAGSGWSDIRKWIVTNDWLDAIIALPEDMFYNTNIATYLWIVRNNKPADRRGTITLVNGNQERFRTLMRRNLGKKRVELTPATISELVGVYREGKPVPKLAQVFDLEDFGYTRVTVERPLRLRFEITDTTLAAFQQSGYFVGLVATKKVGEKAKADIAKGEEKQRALLAALEQARRLCPCLDDRVFLNAINDALPFKATGQAIAALRAAFGTVDEKAEKVLLKPLEPDFDPEIAEADPGNWYVTDSNLRDEERIPLKTDIDAYFAKEVLPYALDAWMDRSKDKVGYEISFTKYFYEYQPPRELKDILADLEALDAEAEKLQAELRA